MRKPVIDRFSGSVHSDHAPRPTRDSASLAHAGKRGTWRFVDTYR